MDEGFIFTKQSPIMMYNGLATNACVNFLASTLNWSDSFCWQLVLSPKATAAMTSITYDTHALQVQNNAYTVRNTSITYDTHALQIQNNTEIHLSHMTHTHCKYRTT